MSPDDPRPAGRGLPPNRLEAFSDGVFAIAITILVLEIAVPLTAESDLLGALVGLWPAYLAYVISFLTIGWVWVGHAAITSRLERVDALFIRLNLLLLMAIAFLPFPTRLMAEYFGEREPEQVAVVFYGIVLIVIAALLRALWQYALKSREMLRSDISDDELANLAAKSTPGMLLLLLSTVVGLVLPTAGAICFLLVSAYLVIPFGSVLGRVRPRR
jgi:uncharacterized membrane protein